MKRILLLLLIIITVLLAVISIFVGYRTAQQDTSTDGDTSNVDISAPFGGEYINLYGCSPEPCASFHSGEYCDTTTGTCEGPHVYEFNCDGNQGNGICESGIAYAEQAGNFDSTDCNQTVQLDVFDKACHEHPSGWDPSCNLLDYIVWYSGSCSTTGGQTGGQTPTTVVAPTTVPTATPVLQEDGEIQDCNDVEFESELDGNTVSVSCSPVDGSDTSQWRGGVASGDQTGVNSDTFFNLAAQNETISDSFSSSGWEFGVEEGQTYTVACYQVDEDEEGIVESEICSTVVETQASTAGGNQTLSPPDVSTFCADDQSRIDIAWGSVSGVGVDGYSVILDIDSNMDNGFYRLDIDDTSITNAVGPVGFDALNGAPEIVSFTFGQQYRLYIAYQDDGVETNSPEVTFTADTCSAEVQSGLQCGASCNPNLPTDPCIQSPSAHTCVDDGFGSGVCVLSSCITDPASCEADLCTLILPKTSLFVDNTFRILLAAVLIIIGIIFYKLELYKPLFGFVWRTDARYKLVGIDKSLRIKIVKEFSDKVEDLD